MRVAVIAGGRTPERDVSLRSGHRVSHALVEGGHESWLVDPGEVPLVEALQERAPDICYLTLHGKEGEDGTVQRLLDLLQIPYTGTAPFDCEVAFDKVLAKDALVRAGVTTPDWVVVEGWALRDLGAGAALARVTERVGLPCVVKPSRSGSALGVSFVERASDLATAVMAALSFAGAAIVEVKVEGSELAVGVVGTPPEALPLVEIVPKSGVFDYAARYTAGATDYFAPARVPAEIAAACTEQALRAVEGLHLLDVARVDTMIEAGGTPWVLEVNVSPGMTETSLLPMAAQAAGWSLAELCERVLRSAGSR
ncbi:MAG: D-alanine--D-alanine ligase family protein [Actinomycetota bacterium]